MRVLVTGATGFIGRRLGVELVRHGHEVVALVRDAEKARRELPFSAELHLWGASVFPENLDAVVHLAGENIAAERWTRARKAKILSSRTDTIQELVEKLRKGPGLKCFLSASAVGFYGDRGDEELNETFAAGTGFLADVCRAWETEAAKASAVAERVASLRFGMVLGRHGGALERLLPVFQRGFGGRLGDGRQWLSWIHLDDLVRLILFALTNDEIRGIVNAVSPAPVRNSEFTRAIAAAFRMPALCTVPAAALKLALGELSQLVLASQRVSCIKLLAAGFSFHYPKLDVALESVVSHAARTRGALCHEFVAEQWLPRPVEGVFSFFSDAKNLESIMPDWLHFRIEAQSTPRIQEGTTFDCRLRVHGIPWRWRGLVLDWKANQLFSDTQQKGPYTFWYHGRHFERLGTGTMVQDTVIYRLPGGYLGDLLGHWRIRADLEKIFAHRRAAVFRKFSAS